MTTCICLIGVHVSLSIGLTVMRIIGGMSI